MLTDWQKETLSATYLNAEVWAMFGEKIPRLHIMRAGKDDKDDARKKAVSYFNLYVKERKGTPGDMVIQTASTYSYVFPKPEFKKESDRYSMKETWIYKKSNERFPFNPKTGKLIKK